MKLSTASPIPALRACVRGFQQREADIETAVVYPIAARPQQVLEFHLRGRYLVRSFDSGIQQVVPCAVVVGPCTHRRVDLMLRGRQDVFTVQFQPSGFHQLFGLPMPELADQAFDAQSVLGPSLSVLERQLADALDFSARVQLVTAFLLDHVATRHGPDPVAWAANRVLENSGALCINEAAAGAGLSVRQFERRFRTTVGIAPRRYARIVRFNAALQAKLILPERNWTDIAHDLGYHDQMHMVHDFRHLARDSPTGLHGSFAAIRKSWF